MAAICSSGQGVISRGGKEASTPNFRANVHLYGCTSYICLCLELSSVKENHRTTGADQRAEFKKPNRVLSSTLSGYLTNCLPKSQL